MPAPANPDTAPVLILGAGINGVCVARELLLNGLPVLIADREDVACGATSKSSRLIHGGLRYLEYGDVGLVRESLEERARLLRLAPQFVRPLRLCIPVRRRHGGLLQAGIRFLKLERAALGRWLTRRFPVSERGLWAVRIGLALYDWIARGGDLPPHTVGRVDQPGVPALDRRQFRWACAYYDAQMLYPERCTLALLEDCRRIAAERQLGFDVWTYQQVRRDGRAVELRSLHGATTRRLEPLTVVNASGAWGDWTLRNLSVEHPPLFSGTKGSHIITRQPALRSALGDDAVYAEARDGRLVFVLPFGDCVLIGTTDLPFAESPELAVATSDEVDYLVRIVNEVFPDVALRVADVAAHYCGVRPLPNVRTARAGAIPRGHWVETHVVDGLTIDTLVGGKLTTCRAFGELAADRILQRLGRQRTASTRDRPVPGAEDHPDNPTAVGALVSSVSRETGFAESQVRAVWPLVGTRTAAILRESAAGERASLAGTAIPLAFVDWVIEHEWVTTLDDLVERRLMLAWDARLTPELLRTLAERLVRAGRVTAMDVDAAVAATRERLAMHYGHRIDQVRSSECGMRSN